MKLNHKEISTNTKTSKHENQIFENQNNESQLLRTSNHENFSSPAEKVDAGEVQLIYKLQPKHPPQLHIVWYQTTAPVLYTTEQRPIHKITSLQLSCISKLHHKNGYFFILQ